VTHPNKAQSYEIKAESAKLSVFFDVEAKKKSAPAIADADLMLG